MRVGSLFSGIGGLDLGFERAGFEIAWQVEIDGYCRKVLAKHWPDVPKYEDVRNVGKHNLEWVDVIVGGFPCQDISNAGKRAGITGERSGLWSEFYRVVCEVRPRYVVVENVAALLHRGIDRVLGDLAEGGYDAEWQVLSASAFGAPHIRARVFIVAWDVAHTDSERLEGQWPHSNTQGRQGQNVGPTGLCDGTGQQADVRHTFSITGQQAGPQAVAEQTERDTRLGLAGFSWQGIPGTDWWAVEPDVGRVANGVPRRVDRLRGLGNAVVPQVAQYVAECVKAHAQEVAA